VPEVPNEPTTRVSLNLRVGLSHGLTPMPMLSGFSYPACYQAGDRISYACSGVTSFLLGGVRVPWCFELQEVSSGFPNCNLVGVAGLPTPVGGNVASPAARLPIPVGGERGVPGS